jgi:glycosyltransferase involved in cell wall biosynthesis
MHTKMTTLGDKLTIVVPCKNEENYIGHMLTALRSQKISDTKIIIADSSTDNTRTVIAANSQFLNVTIVDGGTVSQARNTAAAKVTTPYILFLDADVLFRDNWVIRDAVEAMETQDLDLVTAKIYCYSDDWRAEFGFGMFNTVNSVLSRFSPFAVGAFMLTRRTVFESLGGFDQRYITSEDFFLSRQYDPKRFKILDHYFGQDNRRFKKMGYFGMAGYLVKNFVNRNNPRYWDQLSHRDYWS